MLDNPETLGLLIAKLDRLAHLDLEDKAQLGSLPLRIETAPRYRKLVRERDTPDNCCLLVRGYAARYKLAANGARQIVSFHIPGDLLDIQHLLLGRADHTIEMITAGKVGWIPKGALQRLAQERPAIGQALWKDCLIDASIFREWVLNVGRRDGRSRIAHMLCEFAVRCEAAGMGSRDRFELPMTQSIIGDAVGLTAVHVNRILKLLGQEGALNRTRNEFVIEDWERLCSVADFDPTYLHQAA